jgi:hypothetical protein
LNMIQTINSHNIPQHVLFAPLVRAAARFQALPSLPIGSV